MNSIVSLFLSCNVNNDALFGQIEIFSLSKCENRLYSFLFLVKLCDAVGILFFYCFSMVWEYYALFVVWCVCVL